MGIRNWDLWISFWKLDATIISDAWALIYAGIKDCNVPLSYVNDAVIDKDIANRLTGELRFFRAYFHFVAVQYWGDIPLLIQPVESAEEALL